VEDLSVYQPMNLADTLSNPAPHFGVHLSMDSSKDTLHGSFGSDADVLMKFSEA